MTDRPGAEYDLRHRDQLRAHLGALGSAVPRHPRDSERSRPHHYRPGAFVPRPM
ncbi:hypothetical protein [Pseudonocardia sp. C8]|uniref:hypothetical protein n=1 Tax=Pseudonocardia sp. C8 TaxID=2762759 RepID=UPI002102DA8F|nr:hypothetical protein [Pseudonocardia sp. C8]